MSKQRGVHGAGFKAKVALEAVREAQTLGQLSKRFGVYPAQVSSWKQRLVEQAADLFADGRCKKATGPTESELFEEIGRLKVELEWLKKKHDSLP